MIEDVKKRKIKNNKLNIVIFFMMFIIIFLFFALTAFKLNINTSNNKIIQPKKVENNVKKQYITKNSLSLIMVGDCLIHGAIYDDAKTSNGSYDFTKMVDLVKPIIEEYDLAFYNQESILGGTSLGLSSYPTFNSPQEVGDTFIDIGFNLVSLANNHTLDRGKKGIYSSLEYWHSKKNIMTAGSYSSELERITPNIMEKNGIKYALLSYTTTTNGLNVPKDEPYLISVYNKDTVKEDIERLRDKTDLLMVSMHWGEEYTNTPTESQKEIASYLANLGVDIIIGHHPHVVQPIDFIDNTMVIYSLGNFLASQYGVNKLTGLMASVTVNKTTIGEKSFIKLEFPKAELVYTYSKITNYRHSYRIYPYRMLNDELLKGYKEHYDKYMSIVTSMSDKVIPVGFKNIEKKV